MKGNWSFLGLDEYKSDDVLSNVELLQGLPAHLQQFLVACCTLFAIIGVPGNLVSIIALTRYKKARNPTAIFIINLSTSDLLFCCFVLPLSAATFEARAWLLGKTLCRVYPLLKYSLNAISLFSIMAITINRYVLIAHTLYYPKLYSKRNMFIMVVNIWVWAFGIFVPTLFEKWGRFSLDPDVGFCSIIPDRTKNSPKMFLTIIAFVIPCTAIFFCYGRILWLVRNSKGKSSKPSNASSSSADAESGTPQNAETTKVITPSVQSNTVEESELNNEKSNGTLTKFRKRFRRTYKRIKGPTKRDQKLRSMIAAIMVSFFVCHLPGMVAKPLFHNISLHPYGYTMTYLLKYLTTCINPLIYVVMSNEYRQAYSNLWNSCTLVKSRK